MRFESRIISWYKKNKRDLPWRNTTDPYPIWLSEIILQQTRVDQGLPYFLTFLNAFPTIKELANAPEESVMKLWQGLGYYSRARNLHHTAKIVSCDYKGVFPKTYTEILSLKGIGEYTAAAISSFAFGLPYPVVDGNVYRVLSRYFGIDVPIDTGKGKKLFADLAEEVMDKDNPAEYNQAIMEFGATQCVPQKPDCNICPLQDSCMAFNNKKIELLPVKSKKTKQRARYFHYLFITDRKFTFLNKRVGNDIWKNLYDFPLIETSEKLSESDLIESETWQKIFKDSIISLNVLPKEHKHILSHQKIHARFVQIEIEKQSTALKLFLKNSNRLELKNIDKYPVPRLIEKFLDELKITG